MSWFFGDAVPIGAPGGVIFKDKYPQIGAGAETKSGFQIIKASGAIDSLNAAESFIFKPGRSHIVKPHAIHVGNGHRQREFHLEIFDKRIAEFEVHQGVMVAGGFVIIVAAKRGNQTSEVDIADAINIVALGFPPDPIGSSAQKELLRCLTEGCPAGKSGSQQVSGVDIKILSIVKFRCLEIQIGIK